MVVGAMIGPPRWGDDRRRLPIDTYAWNPPRASSFMVRIASQRGERVRPAEGTPAIDSRRSLCTDRGRPRRPPPRVPRLRLQTGLPAMKCHTLRGQPWSPPPDEARPRRHPLNASLTALLASCGASSVEDLPGERPPTPEPGEPGHEFDAEAESVAWLARHRGATVDATTARPTTGSHQPALLQQPRRVLRAHRAVWRRREAATTTTYSAAAPRYAPRTSGGRSRGGCLIRCDCSTRPYCGRW